MPRIHILTPYLTAGDAVSSDVFGMVRWFRLHNLPADAYAQYSELSLRGQVQPITAFQRMRSDPRDVLIYHHSSDWELGLQLFQRSRQRKVLKYHSVTPGRFFERDPGQAAGCLRGEMQTRTLLQSRPEGILADSAFNARELIALGADPDRCRVVSPFHTLDAREDEGEDEALAERLRDRTNVLFVGRVVPNKGHRHLIRAFAHYHHFLNPDSRLIIVGRLDPQFASYLTELRWEIARQEVDGAVCFPGRVTARQLQTYYAHASVFLCASEHEGFCVPLIEAMQSGVPIVAYGSSAISETLGDAGLVWPTPDPVVLAESIHAIQTQPHIRERVVEAQRRRYREHFTTEAISTRFEEVMAPLLALDRAECLA